MVFSVRENLIKVSIRGRIDYIFGSCTNTYIVADFLFSVYKVGLGRGHKRRIKTEEKAKVIAAAWGAEAIHFFASLDILHHDDFKNRMNCTRTI